MVRSMIAGVAGLKSHQSKLDVIGNNIANVNTWGFKSFSYNFQDAVYSNSINSTGGSQMAGAAGGHNASQVGYGSSMSSISTEFNTGAGSPSSNNMDCMIDGTGFFLVGNMVNGSFDDVASSGLFLSRVGIFRVDNNGYLVDNQGSYVYGYAPIEGTGTPEIPAKASSTTIKDAPVKLTLAANPGEKSKITIAGIEVETSVTSENDFEDAVNDWITAVTKQKWVDE
ncbi:MAG: flagellar hook-basal body complex protein, partial [Lachnospiraceae bacterium]|nr:flagellar hook-basal body complex protein [Lachnospiraceae bacterium]